jgi:very-long-chain enoyl-CoA reductase
LVVIAWAFVAVSSGQMLIWAQKKHRAYKKEFGDKYPRGRKAMIPFII